MASLTKNQFLRKSSAPGSEAARDKWLVKENVRFLRQSSAPGSEAVPDKWFVQKKVIFLEKKFYPRQRSCPGQVARSRESEQPLRPRARSAFWGVRLAKPPGKAGGCGGAQPPCLLPPSNLSQIYGKSSPRATLRRFLTDCGIRGEGPF